MRIILNDESFRYDVHSLVKAFYPSEELNYDIITHWDANYPINIALSKDGENLYIYISNELSKNRPNAKNVFKKELYDILSAHTGKQLKWGTLTGIRPVKLPVKLLQEEKSIVEIKQYLKETYYISDEKNDLICDIAILQQKLLQAIDFDKSYSLYVGIPFCPTICEYCSFSSYPIGLYKEKVSLYLSALKKELKEISLRLRDKKLISIYIGGGTPSSLSAEELKDLIAYIKESFSFSYLKEFSIECGRPDTITKEKLKVLSDEGIDRISINPQTMNDKTLRRIGRLHSSTDIINAFELARDTGIKVINCDLIAGLPGEKEDEIKYTLNKIRELNPNNLTIHSLALKRASRLSQDESFDYYEAINEESFELFINTAKSMGLSPYYLYRQKQIAGNLENIGFSKEGLECIYNVLIMGEYHNIIACGANSISKFIVVDEKKPVRVTNIKDVDLYINRIDEMIERKLEWL